MDKEKQKELNSIRAKLKRADARAREAQQYADTLRKREQQLGEEELLEQIHRMQEAGESVFSILEMIKLRQEEQLTKESEVVRNHEI